MCLICPSHSALPKNRFPGLLPWNAFINAEHYFQSRLCSVEKSSTRGNSIELWFGLVFNIAGTVALSIILGLRKRQERLIGFDSGQININSEDSDSSTVIERNIAVSRHRESHWNAVYLSLSIYLLVFLGTNALVLVPTVDKLVFVAITLVGIGLCGASMSVTGYGVTAVAAMFPSEVGISSYVSGQAIGALAVSVSNFFAVLAENPKKYWDEHCGQNSGDEDFKTIRECHSNEVDWATFIYFSFGSFFLMVCIISFYILDFHLSRDQNCESDESLDLPPDIVCDMIESSNHDKLNTEENQHVAAECPLEDLIRPLISGEQSLSHTNSSSHNDLIKTTAEVWSAIKSPSCAVFVTLFIATMIVPAWVTELTSVGHCQRRNRLQNDLFTPFLFVIFNAGDLIGRLIAGKMNTERIKALSSKILIASLARLFFLPLFLACTTTDKRIPFAITDDSYTITLLFVFALTNGMVLSIAFMQFPSLIPPLEGLQEVGSAIINFSLSLGLLFGSFASFLFIYVGTGHF